MGKRTKRRKAFPIRTITAFLFVTTQVSALVWVSLSYVIAAYSTIKLGQPFPVEDISQKAIETILGTSALKVVENIFEHNDGVVFGRSVKSKEESEEPKE